MDMLSLFFACGSLLLAGFIYLQDPPLRHHPLLTRLSLIGGVMAVCLYAVLGTPSILFQTQDSPSQMADDELRMLIVKAEETLNANPNNPTDWLMLARAWALVDDKIKTQETLARALTYFPDNIPLLETYALFYQQEDEQKAQDIWRDILRLVPDHVQAQRFLSPAARP